MQPLSASAWGNEGHRIVAAVAEAGLSPGARQRVNELLALEPGASLESISNWADEVKSPTTARWHDVNLPRDAGCTYVATRDCPEGQCVVSAIRTQTAVLASPASADARLKSLKYLVHLVADLHQPLHAGFADDRGGNQYQVQAFGHGTNLHALWDTGLIEAWPGGPGALRQQALAATGPSSGDLEPERWAEESCRIASHAAFYPERRKVGADYAAQYAPVLQERLSTAGRRLAAALNKALAPQ